MTNLSLLLLFGTIISLIAGVRIFLWYDRKKDAKNLQPHWEAFQKAVAQGNLDGLDKYGHLLRWNRQLKKAQLEEMIEIVKDRIDEHPELEELRINLMNKQIYYERIIHPLDGTIHMS